MGDGNKSSLAYLGSHWDELRDLLAAACDVPPDADRVVRFAAAAVVNSDHCGLTLTRGRRRPTTVAATGDLPRWIDALQYEVAEGPVLGTAVPSDVVRVDDLGADPRWPEFARRCSEAVETRSMFSVRLRLSDTVRTTLSFYADRAHAFDEMDVGVGVVLAPFAAMALQGAVFEREITDLRAALNTSRRIGAAIGILMARQRITSDQAFAQLAKVSQNLNRKLRDIAQEVTETGLLPELPGKPAHLGPQVDGSPEPSGSPAPTEHQVQPQPAQAPDA